MTFPGTLVGRTDTGGLRVIDASGQDQPTSMQESRANRLTHSISQTLAKVCELIWYDLKRKSRSRHIAVDLQRIL